MLSPTTNLVLNLLRMVLLALLTLLVFGFTDTRGQGWRRITAAAAILVVWLVLPVFSLQALARRCKPHLARAPSGLATPSVNSSLSITLGEDRWVLCTGGPQLGPAVLFWGVVLVIMLVAVVLGRIPLTPLID